jgi:hypothetical protein
MRTQARLILASFLIAAPAAAIAQAPPTPVTPSQATAPPPPQRSSECAPSRPRSNTAPGQTTGQAQDFGKEPLGDRLAESNGVLCPLEGVDPAMRAPAPDVGKTPVIPPPGSPGGDPNVVPK